MVGTNSKDLEGPHLQDTAAPKEPTLPQTHPPRSLHIARLAAGAVQATGVVVIIDVFRAFTTACHVLAQRPRDYLLVRDDATATRLARATRPALLIGKPAIGSTTQYTIPNSPERASALSIEGQTVIHRTGAGARGVLDAINADVILAAGFANLGATVRLLRQSESPITLVCMGHEGDVPALEDELCAAAIEAGLGGRFFELVPHLAALRAGTGAYFFTAQQGEYPEADFAHCTAIDAFGFALRADRLGNNHARLVAVES